MPDLKNRRKPSPARLVAFEILQRVAESGAFASVLLAARAEELPAKDRRLCHELVMGVLRRQLWLDRSLAHFANREAAQLDPAVRLILQLGLYQLRFLSRVPASAAVNEAVELVRAARLRSAATFVNAVLRRATREPEFDPLSGVTDAVERLAVETSHPPWLIARWSNAFGSEDTGAFARANNANPTIAFRVVHNRAAEANIIESIRAAGTEVSASPLAPGAWCATGSTDVLRRLALDGVIYLQAQASQLVAPLLGAKSGERILDVCAAPGSKSTHIADLTKDRALIISGDVHQHRLLTLKKIAANQGLSSIKAVSLDGLNGLPFAPGSFDRVLVDAPCSGTGTLQRNPEIRWRISPADIGDLATRQVRILTSAAQMLKLGGRLVYSTCSVEVEENENVVRKFLEKAPGFESTALVVAGGPRRTPGVIRIWPHKDNADGFFIAGFERHQ
jgi:16S rRNA (cytosine967-C5)-methyltransferase